MLWALIGIAAVLFSYGLGHHAGAAAQLKQDQETLHRVEQQEAWRQGHSKPFMEINEEKITWL